MIPDFFFRALAMIFLGTGGMGASKVALHFDQPVIALGYLLAGLVFLGMGIVRLVRAM
jgi:hypothetical protein